MRHFSTLVVNGQSADGLRGKHRPSVTVSVNTFDVIDKDGAMMLWQSLNNGKLDQFAMNLI